MRKTNFSRSTVFSSSYNARYTCGVVYVAKWAHGGAYLLAEAEYRVDLRNLQFFITL